MKKDISAHPVNSLIQNTAILFYNQQGEVLLQLRDNIPTINWPNHWGCIGGQVEADETVEEGLIREVYEEIEHTLTECVSMGVLELRENRKYHMFIAPLNMNASDIVLHEGQEVRFFTPSEALTLPLTKGTRALVQLYIETRKV
jgi:8-oxo-dGTP pyrophosphatase MutT (NUDIX family)